MEKLNEKEQMRRAATLFVATLIFSRQVTSSEHTSTKVDASWSLDAAADFVEEAENRGHDLASIIGLGEAIVP